MKRRDVLINSIVDLFIIIFSLETNHAMLSFLRGLLIAILIAASLGQDEECLNVPTVTLNKYVHDNEMTLSGTDPSSHTCKFLY